MKRWAEVARRVAGLKKSAAIDDPPADEYGSKGFSHAPPERKKEGTETQHREQQPKGFFLRVQKLLFPGTRWQVAYSTSGPFYSKLLRGVIGRGGMSYPAEGGAKP